MSPENAASRLPIAQIVAKGSCPICAALKEFQTNLLKGLRTNECARLCNLHGWAVAHAAPAESAVAIFLEAVANPDWKPSAPNPTECDLCKRIQSEKEIRLKEIMQELYRPKLREWLHEHGMLCCRHGRELIERMPNAMQKGIEEIMARNVGELQQELNEFLQQVRKGDHAGGGILGRAAEYLVARRGIEN